MNKTKPMTYRVNTKTTTTADQLLFIEYSQHCQKSPQFSNLTTGLNFEKKL